MRSFSKFFYFALLAFLSFSVGGVKASQGEIEEKEIAIKTASQGAKNQSSELPPKLPFDVIGHVLKFSDLQTFYRFKLVSKGWKQATEKKEHQIPERDETITWILSFRDKDTHVFNIEAFFTDFKMRNMHTKNSPSRLSEAANLYQSHNNLFRFKSRWFGHVSTTEAGFSPDYAALLNDIELLAKSPSPQAVAALQEKHKQLRNILLLWQPYAIANDLALRLFPQQTSDIWDGIEAQAPIPLKQFLSNPYLAGLYGSDLVPQQLPKLQQTLLITRYQLANQEIIKAYQLRDFERIKYITTLYRYFDLKILAKNIQAEINQLAANRVRTTSLRVERGESENKLSLEAQRNSLRQELLEIKQELDCIPPLQLESFSKFSAIFDSLPPSLVSEEAVTLFNTVESWLENLQKKMVFTPQETTQNPLKYFNQILEYADQTVKTIQNYLSIRDDVYPFTDFDRVLTKLNKTKEELPFAYAKAAQKTHALAELLAQDNSVKEVCALYEKEAYFLRQQAYYSDLPSKAEIFIKSAQSYAKAAHIIRVIDPKKAKELAQHASKMTLESLESLMKTSEIDYPEIYMIFKEAASLIIPSDKAKAAEFCKKTADFIRKGDRYIDWVEAALSYIIAGELIKGTDPVKANSLFEQADNQELALMKAIKDEDDLDPENIEAIYEAYKEAALCLEFYNKEKAATFYAKAEEFQKDAVDLLEE